MIGVIGLGYVGLPLLISASAVQDVVGFDVDSMRVKELKSGYDRNQQIRSRDLQHVKVSDDPSVLAECDTYIVCVPTPSLGDRPDLTFVDASVALVIQYFEAGNTFILESTVSPGITRMIAERISASCNLMMDREIAEFYVGYSPERLNPGSDHDEISKIVKVVAGINEASMLRVRSLYAQFCHAGVFEAKSLEAAETSKLLENAQRDVNIAFMNEFSSACDSIGVDFDDVLDAAKTKWNFVDFAPGLVGGHCVPVDPYYFISTSQNHGFECQLMKLARRVNDGVPEEIVSKVGRVFGRTASTQERERRILIAGLTFKENCPDIRNSLAVEVVRGLVLKGYDVYYTDPYLSSDVFDPAVGRFLSTDDVALKKSYFDVVLILVGHAQFIDFGLKGFEGLLRHGGYLFDYKKCLLKADGESR